MPLQSTYSILAETIETLQAAYLSNLTATPEQLTDFFDRLLDTETFSASSHVDDPKAAYTEAEHTKSHAMIDFIVHVFHYFKTEQVRSMAKDLLPRSFKPGVPTEFMRENIFDRFFMAYLFWRDKQERGDRKASIGLLNLLDEIKIPDSAGELRGLRSYYETAYAFENGIVNMMIIGYANSTLNEHLTRLAPELSRLPETLAVFLGQGRETEIVRRSQCCLL